jgi:exodeoxyribonuclease-3
MDAYGHINNVNSVRLRLSNLGRVVEELDPDVICLQETKAHDDVFPTAGIAALGYPHQAISGMKSYNGVAILSRIPFTSRDIRHSCGKEDCRHVLATLENGVEIHNLYIPAGGDIPDPALNDKFAHKLQFLDDLATWGADLAAKPQSRTVRRILVGDLNVAPLETDVWSHKQLLKVVSHTPIEVEKFTKAQAFGGWIDAVREVVRPEERLYSWWSYRASDWNAADKGRRLDHIWISEAVRPHLTGAAIHRAARGWDIPSDHVPVSITLSD